LSFDASRTAYQGKYFEALTGDVRKKEIQTVEELIAKELTIFGQSGQAEYIQRYDMFKE
jgi:hypothetical protein